MKPTADSVAEKYGIEGIIDDVGTAAKGEYTHTPTPPEFPDGYTPPGTTINSAHEGEPSFLRLGDWTIKTPLTRWDRLRAWARETFRRVVGWIRKGEPVGEVKALDAVYGTLTEFGCRCAMIPKDGE